MDIINNVVHDLDIPEVTVCSVSRNEWIPQSEVEGMREEMQSRIAENIAYRNRSAHAAQNVVVR